MDVQPSSLMREPTRLKQHRGLMWQQLFCVSCHTDKGGGWVPAPKENCPHAFYLCDPCYAKYGAVAGALVEPDIVFWQRVRETQFEKFGRELAPHEIVEALKDDTHPLTKLAKDR